jgi:hypothetical protein
MVPRRPKAAKQQRKHCVVPLLSAPLTPSCPLLRTSNGEDPQHLVSAPTPSVCEASSSPPSRTTYSDAFATNLATNFVGSVFQLLACLGAHLISALALSLTFALALPPRPLPTLDTSPSWTSQHSAVMDVSTVASSLTANGASSADLPPSSTSTLAPTSLSGDVLLLFPG